jgi:RNA polymerase sigma factor (sigma-70 family)
MRTDAELLIAWREGEARAGRELFERHIDAVSRFFRNKVGDEREDLIQRTFLSCVEAQGRIREGSTFRAYVLTIARNKLHDHIEARIRHAPDTLSTSVVQLGLSPSAIVAQKERDGLLLQALRALPLDLQTCVELHYWEELSMNELAEVLGVAPGTAKSRLHRARELLRDELARLVHGGGPPLPDTDLDAWAKSLRSVAAGAIADP